MVIRPAEPFPLVEIGLDYFSLLPSLGQISNSMLNCSGSVIIDSRPEVTAIESRSGVSPSFKGAPTPTYLAVRRLASSERREH
jgi:hypothetical protein